MDKYWLFSQSFVCKAVCECVSCVVAVLPAHLADVDGPRQLLVVQLPLRVQDVGGDLAVRTESVLTVGKFVDLGPVDGQKVVRGLVLLTDLQQEQIKIFQTLFTLD